MEVCEAVLAGCVPDPRRYEESSAAATVVRMVNKLNSDIEDYREEARVAKKEYDDLKRQNKEIRAILRSKDYNYEPAPQNPASKVPGERKRVPKTSPPANTLSIASIDATGPAPHGGFPDGADPNKIFTAALQPKDDTTGAKVTFLVNLIGLAIDYSSAGSPIALYKCVQDLETESIVPPKFSDVKRTAIEALTSRFPAVFKGVEKVSIAVWYLVAKLPGTDGATILIEGQRDLSSWVQSLADNHNGHSTAPETPRGVLTVYVARRSQRDRMQAFVENQHSVSIPYGKEAVTSSNAATGADTTKNEDDTATGTVKEDSSTNPIKV
jgi:outer membrane murein-binding lipoprotein Lpp